MAGPWALPVQILYRPGFTSRTGGAPREIVFATVTGTRRHPVRTGWRASGPRNSSSCWDIALSTYEMNVSLLIQIACLGALALLGLCVAPGFAATISRSSEIEASGDLVDGHQDQKGLHFWRFGHQKVERPFWVKRRTIPLQPAVWHLSPSRS